MTSFIRHWTSTAHAQTTKNLNRESLRTEKIYLNNKLRQRLQSYNIKCTTTLFHSTSHRAQRVTDITRVAGSLENERNSGSTLVVFVDNMAERERRDGSPSR